VPYHKPALSPVARAARRVWFHWKYSGSGVTCPVREGEFKSYVGSETGHCPGCQTRDRAQFTPLRRAPLQIDLGFAPPRASASVQDHESLFCRGHAA
jgi:hypothetical protein